ncbi:hypothetical protein WICPIJ_004615 [Wickerhamomyces pijperi]|uniref:Uncharacterized protein n=1 Tax=Wickerhamomyces pijperi TaxID=599730 RepID=A0A9P8Q7Q1_WICPI|nr:hypothetical protein WICPIJ_004615 [Wickerhamomyces pijperi]
MSLSNHVCSHGMDGSPLEVTANTDVPEPDLLRHVLDQTFLIRQIFLFRNEETVALVHMCDTFFESWEAGVVTEQTRLQWDFNLVGDLLRKNTFG